MLAQASMGAPVKVPRQGEGKGEEGYHAVSEAEVWARRVRRLVLNRQGTEAQVWLEEGFLPLSFALPRDLYRGPHAGPSQHGVV
jgi:hypothetical protein